jgi:aspartyl-tRNA(Asn)/glutamyl-tRNA(Gln) amidotransferase subunit A
VTRTFVSTLSRLTKAGALLTEVKMPAFDRQAEYFKGGGLAGAESYFIHRPYAARMAEYDPRVAKRVMLGKDFSAADYLAIGELRAAYIREVEAALAPFDAMIMPTTPCMAPTIAETEASDDDYFRWNARIMRNTGLINFLDGCAVSVPCHAKGAPPVGLMVCGAAMSDRHTLAVAAAIEQALARD